MTVYTEFRERNASLSRDVGSFLKSQVEPFQAYDYTRTTSDLAAFSEGRHFAFLELADESDHPVASFGDPTLFISTADRGRRFSFLHQTMVLSFTETLKDDEGQPVVILHGGIRFWAWIRGALLQALFIVGAIALLYLSTRYSIASASAKAAQPITEIADSLRRATDLSEVHVRKLGQRITEIVALHEAFAMFSEKAKAAEAIKTENMKLSALATAGGFLAHDVRGPMAKVNLVLGQLKEADPGQIALSLPTMLEDVKQGMDRINSLVVDYRDLSTNLPIEMRPTSLLQVVEEVVRDLRIREDFQVNLEVQVSDSMLVLADRQKLFRVLYNICLNAVQALPPGQQRVWISSTPADGLATLCIGNTGSYIEPSALSKVFDVSYTRGKKQGTGLGLAIAFKYVHDHGGRIWCKSSKERGTEFFLELKLVTNA